MKQRFKHLLLVFEVVMHEPRRYPCLCGHRHNCRARVPVVGKNGGEGAKDLGSSLGAIAWSAHTLVV